MREVEVHELNWFGKMLINFANIISKGKTKTVITKRGNTIKIIDNPEFGTIIIVDNIVIKV